MGPKAVLLGSSGMLGRAVQQALVNQGINFEAVSRSSTVSFDAGQPERAAVEATLNVSQGDYIVNCIGVTKSWIDEKNPQSIVNAINVNSLFPHHLASNALEKGARVIQIVTDCVFSGRSGASSEQTPHDPIDVYGKTKSLGEPSLGNYLNLRCSLIGAEEPGRHSLFLEWVRNQPPGAKVRGYTNHLWNGLTASAAASIISYLIDSQSTETGTRHIVPRDSFTKFELVKSTAAALGRSDIEVVPHETDLAIDRTLRTDYEEFNEMVFAGAGYAEVPSLQDLVSRVE